MLTQEPCRIEFPQFLRETQGLVSKEVARIEIQVAQEFSTEAPACMDVFKAFQSLNGGGKNMRAALVRIGHGLYTGVSTSPEISVLAACHELSQTALLVSDDIMDKSMLRRGKPAMHIALQKSHSAEVASNLTWLMGIFGLLLPFTLLPDATGDSPHDQKRMLNVLNLLSDSLLKTLVGQMRDIQSGNVAKLPSSEVFNTYRLKTSHYSVVGPLTSGALLATSVENAAWMTEFGEKVGIGFQIIDDLLPFRSTAEQLGKSVTADIEEGKPTWVITKARELATASEKIRIDALFGRPSITAAEFDEIRVIVQRTGADKLAEQLAQSLVSGALELLDKQHDLHPAYVALLKDLAAFAVNRKK